MKNIASNNFIKLMAYIALVLAGLFALLEMLSVLFTFTGTVINVLKLVRDLSLLLAVGFGAYEYAAHSKKWVKILFWVAIIVFAMGIIFGSLNIFGIIK